MDHGKTIWMKKMRAGNRKALFAIGGPTIELLAKSYDATHKTTTTLTVNDCGYNEVLSDSDTFKQGEYNGIYCLRQPITLFATWLASPSGAGTNKMLATNDMGGEVVRRFWRRGHGVLPTSGLYSSI